MSRLQAFVAVICLIWTNNPVRADDATALRRLDEAKEAYQRRSQSPDELNRALDLLDDAEKQARSAEIKYDVLVLGSRVLFRQGMLAARDGEKAVLHMRGKQKADAASVLLDEYSDAYYYAGLNFLHWTVSQGMTSWQTRKNEVKDYMDKASDVTRTTREGESGETIDGYGPDRWMARLYELLPGILGGDHDLAVRMLESATALAPSYALNVVYLGDSLLKGSMSEKARGRALLTSLLTYDPAVYGAELSRVPETIKEFEAARRVLNGQPISFGDDDHQSYGFAWGSAARARARASALDDFPD